MSIRFITDRLILRPRCIEDLEAYLAMDLDPDVVRFIRPTPPEEEHRAFLKERFAIDHADGLGFWTVFKKGENGEADSFVGWVLLVPLGGAGPEVEIGYRLIQKAWGKGYATEAAIALRDYAFETLKLDQIVAVTHPDNHASQHVLQKIGLKRSGERFVFGQTLPYFLMKSEK